MGSIRRGVAVAAAWLLAAAPAMAGTRVSSTSVRRRANLASVAVQAIAPADDRASAPVGHMEVAWT